MFKVKKMCELIRQYQPNAVIVIGGHIANVPTLTERIDADHIVKGEGVRWFRHFLGEDVNQPIRHPDDYLGIRHAKRGHIGQRTHRRRCRHAYSLGRLSAGMQFLLHLGDVRRKGQLRAFLSNRR